MPRLRIVHAVPYFDPATRFGGPVAQLRLLCRALAGRGHDLRVVTTAVGVDESLPRDRWLERDGYRICYAPCMPGGGVAPYWAPAARGPLAEALRGADLLHLSVSFTHMNVLGRRLARASGVPFIYTPRGCLDPLRLRERRLSKLAFLALFERRIVRDAAALHVLTEQERDQVARQGGDPGKCFIIPNASELDPDGPFPDGAIFRRHAGIEAEAALVLFMSRLHRIKGLDLLVEGFARARSEADGARLVIAGPDEGERSSVEALVRKLALQDAVRFVGPLDGVLRLAALRAADVFALTSHTEGMPNSVLEACAAGAAVLVTPGCNLPEVARAGAGREVTPEPQAVAEALAGMLADRPGLRAMGERGRALVRRNFAAAVVADRIEQMYAAIGRRARIAA